MNLDGGSRLHLFTQSLQRHGRGHVRFLRLRERIVPCVKWITSLRQHRKSVALKEIEKNVVTVGQPRTRCQIKAALADPC